LLFVILLAGLGAIVLQVSDVRFIPQVAKLSKLRFWRVDWDVSLGSVRRQTSRFLPRQSLTGHIEDLASHCRVLLHDHPRHPRLVRRLFLYPLYVLCKYLFIRPENLTTSDFAVAEIAIISTDLAELLGSAIALTLIFPKLPLWAGVILTSLDVLVILALNDGNKGRPVRLFEAIIIALVRTL
jgi:Natural resistance-associated macrophage protein-like